MVRVVYLIGGIASGKSTVASQIEELGAARIDLDQLSRDVLAPGSPLLNDIAHAFGDDLVLNGTLNRSMLAQRVFSSPEALSRLEELELPAIKNLLLDRLKALQEKKNPPACVLVEVPLPDRMGSLMQLADEILYVACPLDVRRDRAIARGMSGVDFDRRASQQLSDEEMASFATYTLDNSGSPSNLAQELISWWKSCT